MNLLVRCFDMSDLSLDPFTCFWIDLNMLVVISRLEVRVPGRIRDTLLSDVIFESVINVLVSFSVTGEFRSLIWGNWRVWRKVGKSGKSVEKSSIFHESEGL